MDEFVFEVATDLDYYGPEATEADVDAYADFARAYLEQRYKAVDIEFVDHYGFHEDPETHQLREAIWDAFCRSV